MQQAAGAEQRPHMPHTHCHQGGKEVVLAWFGSFFDLPEKHEPRWVGEKMQQQQQQREGGGGGGKKEFVFVGDEQRWQQRRKSATKTATPEKSPTTATTRRRRSSKGRGQGEQSRGKERGRRCRRCGIACCSLARRFRHFPFGCRCLFGLLWPSNGAWAAGQQGRGERGGGCHGVGGGFTSAHSAVVVVVVVVCIFILCNIFRRDTSSSSSASSSSSLCACA